MDKKLSIITINFNNESGLRRTLESICIQNSKLPSMELIVIDGGSSDGSLSVVRSFEQCIDYWISEPDNGIFDAMNKGLSKAIGKYINFMNSGDCFVENLIDQDFLDKLNGDIIYGDYLLLHLGRMQYIQQPSYPDFFYMLGKTLCHQSIFLNTHICKKYPFSISYSLMGDWIQLFSIMRNENPVINYIDKPICVYEADGQSNKHSDLRKEQRTAYLKLIYTPWELQELNKAMRLRGRTYYSWIMSSLDKVKRQIILSWLSKWS